MQERRIDVGSVSLHVVTHGDGPPVVLLHGFPEYWYSWRHQIDALAEAGFTAIAPDLRGYGQSDKPRGVAAYRLERLAEDVAGLIGALGHARAHVVGHDWGGGVAWMTAAWHPARVERLVVMNCPHPAIMARRIWIPPQLFRSWYMFLFQLPWVPERRIVREDVLRRAFQGWAARKDAFTDEDVRRYVEAIRIPGAATGAVNYYRAAFRHPLLGSPVIECPTLLIWGDLDRALGRSLIRGTERLAPRLTVHHIPDASHWVQHDRPEAVNERLISFLKETP